MSTDLMSRERLERGYVIILPGIEGRSLFNLGIRRGLVSAGVPCAIEIHDWTYGPLGYFWNLRHSRRHKQQAEAIAEKIVSYRRVFPSQPMYLIGHSAGGAMTLFTLERLPKTARATGGILLVPAISPDYDVAPALARTERGIWNYSSWGDLFFVGLGTLLCGTCDGKHVFSAGMMGFSSAVPGTAAPAAGALPRLRELTYCPAMLRCANFGGHFGPVNPLFVRHWLAPLVLGGELP